MELQEIVKNVTLIASGIISTLIPCIIALKKSIKARIKANNDANIEVANNDMLNQANKLIESAEDIYKTVNNLLKARGDSAGPVKKDSVLTKLQAYAIDKGYKFDNEFWSQKIDEIVALTKVVNA